MSLRFETVVQRVEGLSPEGVLRDRRGRRPPPVLPQMPECTEFGGWGCSAGMNILICAQVEIVPPPFSSRWSLRDANGGG